MTSPLFEAFLSIARALNERGLVPLLMGSVGLEVRTGQSWKARDRVTRGGGRRLTTYVFMTLSCLKA